MENETSIAYAGPRERMDTTAGIIVWQKFAIVMQEAMFDRTWKGTLGDHSHPFSTMASEMLRDNIPSTPPEDLQPA